MTIGRIVVDPRTPNNVFVAATGNLFSRNVDRGVFRSQDGGLTWTKVLFVSDICGAVDLAIPAGTNSGRTFRLKGKGFPAKAGAGDLMATVRIVLPDESDPELETLMRTWREKKPYDPRKV